MLRDNSICLKILTSLFFISSSLAYPDAECNTPRGSFSSQQFPYDIALTTNPPDAYNPNVTVSVIITGTGRNIRDLYVQAKGPYGSSSFQGQSSFASSSFGGSSFGGSSSGFGTGNTIGSWVSMSSDAKCISCQGYCDTAINTNRDGKQRVSLKWNCPRGYSGQVQFLFTIISQDDQMWEQITRTIEIPQSMGQGQFGQGQGQGMNTWGMQNPSMNNPSGWPNQGGQYPQQYPNQYPQQQYPQQQYPGMNQGQYDPYYTVNPYYHYSSATVATISITAFLFSFVFYCSWQFF